MIYQTLADYYDALVQDDEATQAWVDWILSFVQQGDFLELACGSGEITTELGKSFSMTAMDLSSEMVERAKEKEGAKAIQWKTGDMRHLDEYGQYDVIGCFCDSINYILEKDEIESMFEQCAQHLNSDGWFLFDTHSLDRLEEFKESYEETGTFKDGMDVQWVITSEEDFIYQDFAFYYPERTLQEHHIQRVYDPNWLKEVLEKWFTIVSIKTDFDEEGIVPGEKYFFACQKKR